MSYKWNFRTYAKAETDAGASLAKELSVHPVLGTLLVKRGITTPEEAKSFFKPQLHNLYDPFLMDDMRKAVTRLNEAMGRKERLLIYGEYDVDRTTAV